MEQTINTIFTLVLIPLLPTITAYVIAFIRKKTAELQANEKATKYAHYISIAESAVESAVSAVSQGIVDAYKKNGTFDAATQAEAKETARQKAIVIMGSAAKQEIEAAGTDFNTWIDATIEKYVKSSK